jgi:glycosyltransferase involved in cell wall biosynthesis
VTDAAAAGVRPRILMVGRMRYSLPLPDWLERKFDALERQLDLRVVASVNPATTGDDERFRLLHPSRLRLLDGVLFYLRLPIHVRRQIIDFQPAAILAESPYSAAAALIGRAWAPGHRPQIIVEVHGDWRTATRLYGSQSRRVLSPLADTVARIALRRGDAVRALSGFTEGLVEEIRGIPVTASFVAYVDLSAFTAKPVAPLPERPTALFVGMLEAYKNIDGLVAAWRLVVRELPHARLVIVGKGARRDLVDELVDEFPENVEHVEELPPEAVADRMDAATVLVLPSRSEGLPRVVIEAFARGRGLVATRAGGIPDAARHEEEAVFADSGDAKALASALVRVLSDRPLAEELARNAHERFRVWRTTPAEYAARVRSLVDATLRDSGAVPGERPRVLIVSAVERSASPGRSDAALDALREEVDYCVLAPAERGAAIRRAAVAPGAIQLVRRWPGFLDGLFFYAALPFRVRRLVRRFRPGAIIAESPYIGFFVLLAMSLRRRDRPSVVVETHRDWRTTARVGGSRLRFLFAPLADWAARYALRHADALRALSPSTADLAGREASLPPVESFPAYIDLGAFTGRAPVPLPAVPTILFVECSSVRRESRRSPTRGGSWRSASRRRA